MQRLNPFEMAPEALKALVLFGASGYNHGLDVELIDIVKARTLQLTGGKYGKLQCERISDRSPALATRLASLEDWYSSRLFSPRERSALLWTEDLVYATSRGVPDISYAEAANVFAPESIWALAVIVTSMCAWAQIAQTFQMEASVV